MALTRVAAATAVVWLFAACTFSWDDYDPRLDSLSGEGGAFTSAGGAAAPSTTASSGDNGGSAGAAEGGAGGIGGATGGAGGCDCDVDETCEEGVCVGALELVHNGDFGAAFAGWTRANNDVNGEDTTALWDVVDGVCVSEGSSGPSARVLYQDLAIPSVLVSADISFDFAQEVLGGRLDPQNVTVIEKDPYDESMSGGEQNAFRIDLVDPGEDVFYAPILLEIYAPTGDVGALDDLQPVAPQPAGLSQLLEDHAGGTLRLRIAKVESTFPWPVQIDDVSLVVVGAP